jgi:hypothetical protein
MFCQVELALLSTHASVTGVTAGGCPCRVLQDGYTKKVDMPAQAPAAVPARVTAVCCTLRIPMD